MSDDELLGFNRHGYKPRTFKRPVNTGYHTDEHSDSNIVLPKDVKPIIPYNRKIENK